MDTEILKAIGYVFCVVIVGLITFFTGKKFNVDKSEENPVVTEARLLKFKAQLDDEYAKKEEVNCISGELSEVSGKFDKFIIDMNNNFNELKLDLTTKMATMNTSIAVMAEAMKYIPKRKEDSNANN